MSFFVDRHLFSPKVDDCQNFFQKLLFLSIQIMFSFSRYKTKIGIVQFENSICPTAKENRDKSMRWDENKRSYNFLFYFLHSWHFLLFSFEKAMVKRIAEFASYTNLSDRIIAWGTKRNFDHINQGANSIATIIIGNWLRLKEKSTIEKNRI